MPLSAVDFHCSGVLGYIMARHRPRRGGRGSGGGIGAARLSDAKPPPSFSSSSFSERQLRDAIWHNSSKTNRKRDIARRAERQLQRLREVGATWQELGFPRKPALVV